MQFICSAIQAGSRLGYQESRRAVRAVSGAGPGCDQVQLSAVRARTCSPPPRRCPSRSPTPSRGCSHRRDTRTPPSPAIWSPDTPLSHGNHATGLDRRAGNAGRQVRPITAGVLTPDSLAELLGGPTSRRRRRDADAARTAECVRRIPTHCRHRACSPAVRAPPPPPGPDVISGPVAPTPAPAASGHRSTLKRGPHDWRGRVRADERRAVLLRTALAGLVCVPVAADQSAGAWRGICQCIAPWRAGYRLERCTIYVQVPDTRRSTATAGCMVADVFVGQRERDRTRNWIATNNPRFDPASNCPQRDRENRADHLLGSQHLGLSAPADPSLAAAEETATPSRCESSAYPPSNPPWPAWPRCFAAAASPASMSSQTESEQRSRRPRASQIHDSPQPARHVHYRTEPANPPTSPVRSSQPIGSGSASLANNRCTLDRALSPSFPPDPAFRRDEELLLADSLEAPSVALGGVHRGHADPVPRRQSPHRPRSQLQRPLRQLAARIAQPPWRASVDADPALQHRRGAKVVRGDYINVSLTHRPDA